MASQSADCCRKSGLVEGNQDEKPYNCLICISDRVVSEQKKTKQDLMSVSSSAQFTNSGIIYVAGRRDRISSCSKSIFNVNNVIMVQICMQWGGVTQQSASALHSVPAFSASFASVSWLKTTKAALGEVFKSTSCQQRDYLCLGPVPPN